jgi:trans-2-enoyl-CoA reductase
MINTDLASYALFPILQARTYSAAQELFEDMIRDESDKQLQFELTERLDAILFHTESAETVDDLWKNVWPDLFDAETDVEDLMCMLLQDRGWAPITA